MNPLFPNRVAAGKLLAAKLISCRDWPGLVVLAVPHGGVPVAAEVARLLHAPLDVLEVRKLAAPPDSTPSVGALFEAGSGEVVRGLWGGSGAGPGARGTMPGSRSATPRRGVTRSENLGMMEMLGAGYGLGAVASGDFRVLNSSTLNRLAVKPAQIENATKRGLKALHRWERTHRHGRPALELRGRPVLVVDDVIATGSTMRVAIAAVRAARAGSIVVATPVASRESYLELRGQVRELVSLWVPREFGRIGNYFTDFEAVSDAEVRRLLDHAKEEYGAVAAAASAL